MTHGVSPPETGQSRTAAVGRLRQLDEGARRQESVGSFFATPPVADGTVFIGSSDSNVYAIE